MHLSLLLHAQADPGRGRAGRPGAARAFGRGALSRHLPGARPDERERRIQDGEPYALRLDVGGRWRGPGRSFWDDVRAGPIPADPLSLGDVVLARKDVPTSYHLAVTVDDHLQGVTLVTRGEDLFHATHVHRLLQALLGLRTPRYYHHNLIADSSGQRLAKRNRAITLRHLRDCRRTPDDVWRMIGLAAGPTTRCC